MTIYVVQAAGSDATALERARFVPDDFSWPAFILADVWLLYHRLWLSLVIWIVSEGVFVVLILPHLSMALALLVGALAHLYAGFEGNRWRLAKGDRAAVITDVVAADRHDKAEADFFRRYVPATETDAEPTGRAEA